MVRSPSIATICSQRLLLSLHQKLAQRVHYGSFYSTQTYSLVMKLRLRVRFHLNLQGRAKMYCLYSKLLALLEQSANMFRQSDQI